MKLMFKVVLTVILFSHTLFGDSGKEIFKKKCESCHVSYISNKLLRENFMEYNNTKLKLKAPTLNMISFRLKEVIGNRDFDADMHKFEVVEFIKSYVKKPDQTKSKCIKKVLEVFHTMHSMKGKISDEELQKVAEYIYNYDAKELKQKGENEKFLSLLKEAKKQDKIILVEATSSFCHYCKKMDREVLSSEEVKKLLDSKFLILKVDLYKDKIPLGIQVSVTPTYIFIDKNKKLLNIVKGVWSKKEFIDILKSVEGKR